MDKLKDRECFCWFFIGHNRTGKTVGAMDLIKIYKKNNPKNNIIAFDPQNRLKNVANDFIYSENWEDYFKEDKQTLNISDTLFVLDDYRALMDKDTTDKYFLKMLMLRNEYGLDFIFITHNPKLILERISYYISHFSIYYVSGDNSSFVKSDKLACGSDLMQVSTFVNNYVRKHGKGSYSENKNFRFAFVDTINESVQLFNMEHATIKGNVISY